MRIAFISPDYHCSFIYARELLNRGHFAKIYVPDGYNENLLYSNEGVLQNKFENPLLRRLFKALIALYLLSFSVHIYYGNLNYFNYRINFLEKRTFNLYLFISKLLRIKIVNVPSGCSDEDLKENFQLFDNGNVCSNCGVSKFCDDRININKFNIINKYSDLNVGLSCFDSKSIKLTHFKYKSIDLSVWHPHITVPAEFKIHKKPGCLYVLHSFFDEGRINDQKNEKGSQYILKAINRLKEEGYSVEYLYVNNVHSSNMKFYQVQADLVIEQLIYGWWGSTGVECMSLGRPTICYIRPEWKNFFLDKYKNIKFLPIIEADTKTIYSVLKNILECPSVLISYGEMSRSFAEQYFDVKTNCEELLQIIKK
jgi:glycosyltransferase involved in cell wall biosynthesis